MLVLHCVNSGELSICLLRQCCVVISQRCRRIASFFRLALTQKSGAEIHRYFRNAVLDIGKFGILIKHFIHVIWGIAVCKKIHAFLVRKHILYGKGIDKVVALQKF